MIDCNVTASCLLTNTTPKPVGKVSVKAHSTVKQQENMNDAMVKGHGGTEKKSGNWRYRMALPPIQLNYHHDFDLFCADFPPAWSHYHWGRLGSGGQANARHCFVDDYRLEHLWRRPGQGLLKAIEADIITAPDFTIDESFPAELVQYQVWRSRVLAAYWQEYDVHVIPTLQWGCPESFPICARGIRRGSVVAVRGPQRGSEPAWAAGAAYMQNTIQPQLVLHFGNKLEIWNNAIYLPLRTTKKLLSTDGCTKSGTGKP